MRTRSSQPWPPTFSAPKFIPNDHVNMSQSSNDVIPTCVHVSAADCVFRKSSLPALAHVSRSNARGQAKATMQCDCQNRSHASYGRHARDTGPGTRWLAVADPACVGERLEDTMERLTGLAQGGTAVGTGINAHPKFGSQVARSCWPNNRCRRHSNRQIRCSRD